MGNCKNRLLRKSFFVIKYVISYYWQYIQFSNFTKTLIAWIAVPVKDIIVFIKNYHSSKNQNQINIILKCIPVIFIVSFLMESFTTEFTNKWFVSIVDSHVCIQSWTSKKINSILEKKHQSKVSMWKIINNITKMRLKGKRI